MDLFKKKIVSVYLIFIALFLLVFLKAFKVQVLDREHLFTKSKGQTLREVKVFPKRGSVYDRNGDPLAINVQTYSIFTIPKFLKNKRKTYTELSNIVPELPLEKILRRTKNRKRYTWLVRKIKLTKDQVMRVKNIKGVYIESVPNRIYPNKELLSQVLGFVGVDNVGLSGVEYTFNKELRGNSHIFKYIKDAKGRPIKFETKKKNNSAKSLNLSIDKDLQAIAEKYLKEAVKERNAKLGGIGVLDAKTGEVLAMANYPTFDPNHVKKSDAKDRRLSFVSAPIEPGSTLKIFTVASALENKIARRDTNFYCEKGRLEVEGHFIKEAESKKKYEWLSVEDIIKYSSNVGTTKIAFDLTYPRLKKTLEDFNFGKKTGIELPAESRGIFTRSENVSPLSLSNISFGQGIATTGIQMLAAYGAIANGGEYIWPTLLKGKRNKRKRIISKETAKELEKMLLEAVKSGTGRNARVPYFKIAGKTSTAQRPGPHGGYKGYISGFVGFPVGVKNKFVIYVYVDDPKGVYYGNSVAAPVFRKVAEYMLYKDKDFSKMAVSDQKKGLDHIWMKQSSVRTFGKNTVPNFIGLDKSSAKKLAKKYNVLLKIKGMGIVSDQDVAPGTIVSKGAEVFLDFTPPAYE